MKYHQCIGCALTSLYLAMTLALLASIDYAYRLFNIISTYSYCNFIWYFFLILKEFILVTYSFLAILAISGTRANWLKCDVVK